MLNIENNQQIFLKKKIISKNVLKILYRLNYFGFQAYLVGGWVRDTLLGIEPNDFDIVTNATPEEILNLFRNSRLIGKRFYLVHIIFTEETIEVSTFRQNVNNSVKKNKYFKNSHGMLIKNNIFGSIEEDAKCRDFSINSIYYNAINYTIKDFFGGISDLKNKIIRIIGNPEIRYKEDPVRILRAIRFSAKLNMQINHETSKFFLKFSILLRYVSPSRLFEECLKLFQSGYGKKTFILLEKYNLLHFLFPAIKNNMKIKEKRKIINITIKALKKIDSKFYNKKKISPAFLFSVILWYP